MCIRECAIRKSVLGKSKKSETNEMDQGEQMSIRSYAAENRPHLLRTAVSLNV